MKDTQKKNPPLNRRGPLRRFQRTLTDWGRLLTSPVRLLPNFLIIGTQKGGTSSLYAYLVQHPSIAAASRKEVRYFDANYEKGPYWYRAQFPTLFYKYYVQKIQKRPLITGEASPFYIFSPGVPERVYRFLPDAKLIAVLRNPVDRAFSDYHHAVRGGHITDSFENVVQRQLEQIAADEAVKADENYLTLNCEKKYTVIARGIYFEPLKRWDTYFGKAQRLVLNSSDLFQQPAATFKRVLEFLELPDWELPEYKVHLAGGYKKKMDPGVRKLLTDYYTPHNQKLYRYLGETFDWQS